MALDGTHRDELAEYLTQAIARRTLQDLLAEYGGSPGRPNNLRDPRILRA